MDRILLLDKPAGITSHDAVDRVRRIFKTRKVGHAGTLDPFATGLLILGVGDATKRLSEYVGLDKTYEATARLGAASTTFDTEGTIVEFPISNFQFPNKEDIARAFDKFRGGYDQKAPIYSAKKISGKKLYELARQGKATEALRPTKHVMISELALLEYNWPTLRFRITCSSGTYIRSLADDIGRALGCGAYLSALKRTRIGRFSLNNAQTLDTLEKN